MEKQTQKREWKEAGSFIYSQFIEVDVNPQDKPEKWVRACKEKDFNRWLLEKKNLQILPIDYVRVHPDILKFLQEYLDMKICGWRINAIKVEQNELLLKDEANEEVIKV